jgi:uncharacterized protein
MPIFAVSAHDLDAAGLALDAEIPLAWLAEELAGTDVTAALPGHLSARLSRSGHDVVVRGRVKAALSVPCARCLDPAAVPVDTELSLLLHPGPASPPRAASKAPHSAGNGKPKPAANEDEYEFAAGEADHDTFDGETVVLDPFVREAILLEVPNFPLCSEGCPGIRPAAAEAPPEPAPRVDPRLAPLGALRDKLSPTPGPAPKRPPTRTTSKKKTKE